MRAVSLKRARENRKRAKLLKERRGEGLTPCEARLPGCWGTVTDGHEIKTAGRGGSRVDLTNIRDLCRGCHTIVTDNPGWADRHGWTVPSWATPGDIGIARRLRSMFRCDTTCDVDHRHPGLALAT